MPSTRTIAGIVAVVVAVIGGVAFVELRKPDAGTAKDIANKVDDPPDDCSSPDIMALKTEDLAAWRRRAERSAIIVCGDAGPGLAWAHFRSPAVLEAALRAASGAPEFVCRAPKDLVRMNGFSRSSETRTCAALGGQPVRR